MESKNNKPILIGIIVLIIIIILIVQNPLRNSAIVEETSDLETIGTKVGNKAPDFVLTSLDGKQIKLSDFEGEKVIVNFWATWCPFCADEMPAFQKAQDENEDLVILGVNLQETNKEAMRKFLENLGVSYTILLDSNAEVKNRYGVFTQPVTFFLDEDRVIQEAKFGPLTGKQIEQRINLLVSNKDIATKSIIESSQEIKTLPDGTKYIVHPNKLLSGGPSKDGIPSIDDPEFITIEEADEFLDDDELVLALDFNGKQRAYPFQILVWHEIVNDKINGKPVLVTYCPLCGTGIVFERLVNEEEIEFGVSGKLYNSNLVMYDRKTDSYWYQVTGQAIIGEFTGTKLKVIDSEVIQWKNFKQAFPNADVLSRDTGYTRSYGADPYEDYYASSRIIFSVENQDQRLHTKAIVYGIEINGKVKAYPEDVINKREKVTDNFNGVKIEYNRDENDAVTFINLDTSKNIIPIRSFWFAWVAAYPDTELF